MEIVQEIGAYAGLAAVVGLAVLSALYFSQARDIRRLREWAGRAPERSPEATGHTQAPRVTAQPRRTGPIRPGQPVRPGQAPARPAQAGAKPATAVGGAAAGGAAAGAAAGAAGAGPSSPAARSAAGGAEAPPTETGEPDSGTGHEEPPETAGAGGNDDVTQVARPGDVMPAADTGDEDEEPGAEEERVEATPSNGAPEGDRPAPPVRPALPGAPPALPPRPAARLPARSAPPPGRPAGGHTEVIPPSQPTQPWYRRDPRLAVLAVAGVLIVGGAAVFGLTKIGEEGDQQASQSASNDSNNGSERSARRPRAAVSPASVSVSVLNGTNIPGLAAQIGDEVEAKGFQLGNVTNASDQGVRNESVVFFARGAEREAIAVGRGLDISQREPIDARTQSLAGDARVVVVAGSDKTR